MQKGENNAIMNDAIFDAACSIALFLSYRKGRKNGIHQNGQESEGERNYDLHESLNVQHVHFIEVAIIYSFHLMRFSYLLSLLFFVVLCLAAVHILVLSEYRCYLNQYLLMLKILPLKLLFQRMMIISMTFSMPLLRSLRRLMMMFHMMQMRRSLWL